MATNGEDTTKTADLQTRRARLVEDLQRAQMEASAWAQRAQQLQGALAMLDELLGQPADRPPTPPLTRAQRRRLARTAPAAS